MISSRPVFLWQLTCFHSSLKTGSIIGLNSKTKRHKRCLISQLSYVPRAIASVQQVCKVRDSLMKVSSIFHWKCYSLLLYLDTSLLLQSIVCAPKLPQPALRSVGLWLGTCEGASPTGLYYLLQNKSIIP